MDNWIILYIEVSSEHHRSAQLASQAVDKGHMANHHFRQKEDIFCMTFLVGWPKTDQ